jgi:hypothetical protein
MATTTSAPSKVGSNFYKTSVTTNADGSLKATTFRTDATGESAVAVSTVNTAADGTSTRSFEGGATAAEKAAFSDPKSPERQAYSQQVQSQNPYGSNPTATQKQNLAKAAGGSGNANGNPAAGDNTAAASEVTDSDIAKSVGDGGVRTKYRQDLSYPITRDPKQDYIKFSMFRYSTRGVSSGTGGLGGDEFNKSRQSGSALGTVSLPINPTITDTNQVVWGEDRLGALGAEGAKLSLSMMQGSKETGDAVDNASNTVKTNAADIKTQIMTEAAKAATGTNSNLFTRLTGAIVNPNLELLFQGPGLRSFSFTFSLSAREEKEAKEIREIIRFFKQGMSVKRASTSLYLKSPNTFKISYIYGGSGKDHPWINRIKECALQSFTVNYTPAGNYATYSDGAMTQYDLSLTFGELEPIYDDDYTQLPGGDSDTEIGY